MKEEGEEEKGWEEEEEGTGHRTVYKIDDVSNKDLPCGRGDASQHSVLIYMGSICVDLYGIKWSSESRSVVSSSL